MLGHLRMTVDDCIIAYTSLFRTIFEKQKHKFPIKLWGNAGDLQERFDSEMLRDAIQQIVRDRGLSETDLFNTGEDRECRV